MSFSKRLFGRKEDKNISPYNPEHPSGPFRMSVEDIFVTANRGVVLTDHVESGTLQKDDPIMVTKVGTHVAALESFHKTVTTAQEGDTIGILLPKDVPCAVLNQDMVVTK